MSHQALHICPSTLFVDPFSVTLDDWDACLRACVGAGFDGVSLWSLHVSMVEQAGRSREDIRAQLAELGLAVSCIEAVTGWANAPSAGAAVADAAFTVEMAASFGADNVIAVLLDDDLLDVEQAAENLGAVADLAAAAGMWVCVEYLPWTGIADIGTAWHLIEASGRPNVGFLFDSWHWHRQPGGPGAENADVLRSIPGDRIRVFQLCDAEPLAPGAAVADAMGEAMSRRPLPGDGVVDHETLFGLFDVIGAQPLVCPEVFNRELAALGFDECASAIGRATRELLGR